ncbi:MAG: uroporphyrinogen-III synthase [Hyphomicrobiales bacterium]|nr:uroporphyrinogen-III synthase [Hyphomicrobiales bacterium]
MTILLTRAPEDGRRTAARLHALGYKTILSPVIEIRATGATAPAQTFPLVIATSAHAFQAAAPHWAAQARLAVVGARTGAAAIAAGWPAPFLQEPDARALVAALRAQKQTAEKALYLAARDRKNEIESAMSALTVCETYEAAAAQGLTRQALDAFLETRIVAVLHFSERAAEIFRALAPAQAANVQHIAISAQAARAIAAWRPHVADAPTEDGVLAALCLALRNSR